MKLLILLLCFTGCGFCHSFSEQGRQNRQNYYKLMEDNKDEVDKINRQQFGEATDYYE